MATNTEYGKVVQVAENAISTAKVSDLLHGDLILVPGKGKRGVRVHSNGKVTLVFPRSGASKVDGKSAGSLSDLGGHDPAVIGYVKGGWGIPTTESAKPKAAPKAKVGTKVGRPAKGSQEAKDRMAAVRAARGSAPKAPRTTAKPSSNRQHFQAALDALGTAIDELRQVEVA